MNQHKRFYEQRGVYGISPSEDYPFLIRTQRTARERVVRSLESIKLQNPTKVLDVGCGDGFFAKQIIDATDATVCGIDISLEAVELARSKGIDAKKCDIHSEGICFESESFDLVFLGEVIEHVFDPDFLLDEINRVLEPGGYLLLSTPNLAAWYNRLLLLIGIQPIFTETSTRKTLGRRFRILGEGSHPVGHLKIFTLGALKEILRESHFTICNVEALPFLPFPGLYQLDKLIGMIPTLGSNLLVLAQKYPFN